VNVALAKQHVGSAPQFHLAAILRFIKNAVAHCERPHVGSRRYNLGPHQASANFGSCGDHDAASRSAFTIGPICLDEHPIMQKLDGKR
jgi:hypothetical protein